MESLYCAVFLILMILILIVYLSSQLSDIEMDSKNVLFSGTQSQTMKRDCDKETVYSVEDYQCDVICKHTGIFISKRGVCVNNLAIHADDHEADHNKCDPKKGVLAYLTGNSQFGNTNMICFSIDVGIQPDDVEKSNILCEGGSIDIDYVKSFPQLYNCKCPENNILTTISRTSTIRLHGVCTSSKLEPIFKHNNLLFSESTVM